MEISSDSRINTPKIDSFSSISLKYRFLFGLTQDSRILIIGRYYEALLKDIENYFRTVHFIANITELQHLNNKDKYDLICLDCYTDWGNVNMAEQIGAAKAEINTSGSLVIAAKHRFSINSVLTKTRHKLQFTLRGYVKTLRHAGFNNIQAFLVLPTLRSPEEYIETELGEVQLPSYVSFVYKVLHWFGVYKYVHTDYLYIASTEPISKLDIFVAHTNKKMSDQIISQNQLLLERFDLRNRGALILMLADSRKKYRFVIRVAVSSTVNAVISRNKAFTDEIHSLPALAPHITNLIPKTVATFEYRDCPVYIETRMPGILAWKQSRNYTIEKVTYKEAYNFIYNFNNATKQEMVVEANIFSAIIGNDLTQFKLAFSEPYDIAAVIFNIETRMSVYFAGRKLYIVWGHGDFGYGNILCDCTSGHIRGVIDWDTHVQKELPGVDFCNLLLQKISAEFNGKIAPALKKLQEMIQHNGKLDSAIAGYCKKDFNLNAIDLRLYACIAALRFIKRSLPYSSEFEMKKDDYVAILRVVNSTLEEMLEARHGASA